MLLTPKSAQIDHATSSQPSETDPLDEALQALGGRTIRNIGTVYLDEEGSIDGDLMRAWKKAQNFHQLKNSISMTEAKESIDVPRKPSSARRDGLGEKDEADKIKAKNGRLGKDKKGGTVQKENEVEGSVVSTFGEVAIQAAFTAPPPTCQVSFFSDVKAIEPIRISSSDVLACIPIISHDQPDHLSVPTKKAHRFPLTGRAPMWLVILVAGLAMLVPGLDQGIMSYVTTNQEFKVLMLVNSDPQTIRDRSVIAGLISVFYAGAVVAALVALVVGDRLGRKRMILLGAVVGLIGAILEASAMSFGWMATSRMVAGIGTGTFYATVPMWVCELSRKEQRGASVGAVFMHNALGMTLGSWMGFGLSRSTPISDSFRWRFPIALQTVIPLLVILIIPFCPESPRWLVEAKKETETRAAPHARRWAGEGLADSTEGDVELQVIKDRLKSSQAQKDIERVWWEEDSLPQTVKSPRGIVLAVGLQVCAELTGVGFLQQVLPSLLTTAGYNQFTSDWLTGLKSSVMAVLAGFAIFSVDRLGRRRSIFIGSGVIASSLLICLASLANVKMSEGPAERVWRGFVAGSAILAVAVYGASWLSIPWHYANEILSSPSRSKGLAVVTMAWAVLRGVMTNLAPFILQGLGIWSLVGFAVFAFSCIPVVHYFYPETAGKDLVTSEDVQV